MAQKRQRKFLQVFFHQKSFASELISTRFQEKSLQRDLKALNPKDRLAFIEKLLPYILPKVERADEVEGAAYTKDDIVTKTLLTDWQDGMETRAVQRWIDKED